MISYVVSALWGILLLLSLIGWGKAVIRAIARKPCDWAQAGIVGASSLIAIGGVLNLAGCIFPKAICGLVAAGAFLTLADILWSRAKVGRASVRATQDNCWAPGWMLLGGAIFVLYAAVRYGGSVITADFNTYDDRGAYMVFPVKMLQIGSYAADPFSERRVVSSLGGGVFLQATALAGSDVRSLKLVDDGIGFLLLAGSVLGMCRDLAIPFRRTLMLLAATTAYFRSFNLTSHVIPCAMFIGIFRIVADANGRATVRAVLLGLVVAALCTLKNTYIPPVMAIVFLSFLLGVKQFGWRAAWGGWAICSLVVGLCLVPWIIAQYGTCGTLLFPLLGRGYSVTAYGAAPSPSTFLTVRTGTTTVMLAVVCVFAALLVCAILPAAPPENGAIRRGALSLLLGSAMSVVVIGYASGGCDMWRYVMPFWFAACLVFGTILFRQAGTLPTAAWLLSLLGTLGGIYIGNFFFPAAIYYGPHWSLRLAWWALPIVFSLVFGWQVLRLLFFTRRARQHISSVPVVFVVCGVVGLAGVAFKSVTTGFKSAICVRDGLRGPAIAPVAQTQKLKALQASFPADEPVLVLVQDPFLLDFSKGRILLFDIPGGASLPPGIPLYRGSEPLAEYLLAQSIRYIAISYSDAVPHPPAGWSAANRHLRKPDRLGFSDSSMTWVDSQLQYRWDVQQNLLELCKTRKIIYRDGESCLLDLVQRR